MHCIASFSSLWTDTSQHTTTAVCYGLNTEGRTWASAAHLQAIDTYNSTDFSLPPCPSCPKLPLISPSSLTLDFHLFQGCTLQTLFKQWHFILCNEVSDKKGNPFQIIWLFCQLISYKSFLIQKTWNRSLLIFQTTWTQSPNGNLGWS